jgi:hypothetical protein
VSLDVYGALQNFTADYGAVTLRQEAGGVWAFNPYVSLPPLGTCTAYAIAGEFPLLNGAPGLAPSGKDLNGGTALSISNPVGTSNLQRGSTSPSFYSALLATSENVAGVLTSFFTPGVLSRLVGAGGQDVGPFQATVTPGASFAWSNQAATTNVSRSAGLTLTWSNVPSGAPFVSILGFNVDQANNVSAGFHCLASPTAGSFSVPAVAMGNVPASSARARANLGLLVVGVPLLGSAGSFSATGLDQGLAVFGTGNAQTVTFQ